MNILAQTAVNPDNDGKTIWEVDYAQELSLIVMMPNCKKELYNKYQIITGVTPTSLKSSLGYIQCK